MPLSKDDPSEEREVDLEDPPPYFFESSARFALSNS
jgi:hypothetical protein